MKKRPFLGAKLPQLHPPAISASAFALMLLKACLLSWLSLLPRKVEERATVIVVITVPADFTERVERHDPAPILVRVNNLNLDFTNDIRRAVPDARETDFATALVVS